MEHLELALGTIVLGNIGVIVKLIGSVRKAAAREARQNARLDSLEKDMQDQKQRNDRIFRKLDELQDSIHAIHNSLANISGQLKGKGVLNGGRHMRPVGPEDYQTRGLDSRG